MADHIELFNPTGIERMLCIVAHPDDMEYGASAAVAEWTALGVEVSYLLLTAGEAGIRDRDPAEVGPLRAEEQRRACEIVGVNDLEILSLPDGLVEPSIATRNHIARAIRRVRPHAVMCMTWELESPWGLNHADHRATGVATIDAIRDADNPHLFTEQITDEGLEAWATDWLLVTMMKPTHAIEVSEASLEKSIASLEAHEAYLAALPDHVAPRDLITGAITAGGEACGVRYALGVRVHHMS